MVSLLFASPLTRGNRNDLKEAIALIETEAENRRDTKTLNTLSRSLS